jgi:hypothetical protein
MKAVRIFYDKTVLPDGAIVQMTIWQLPHATQERPHGLKYSLFYGGQDGRIVGYDDEIGKGDHKHIRAAQTRYRFTDVETLVADFLADVERIRNEHSE